MLKALWFKNFIVDKFSFSIKQLQINNIFFCYVDESRVFIFLTE
jgi:hypothetical protein